MWAPVAGGAPEQQQMALNVTVETAGGFPYAAVIGAAVTILVAAIGGYWRWRSRKKDK